MNIPEPLIIEESEFTPQIILDYEKGAFEFSGRCMPENIYEFFKPIFQWFEAFSENPRPNSVVKFSFDYFNTASSKIIVKILRIVQGFNDKSIYVEWNYKEYDEDIREAGEDFMDIVGEEVLKLKQND